MDNETLEQRRSCITGTDIGSILGINPWKSALSVYYDKLGLTEPFDNAPMEWGRRLESVVADKFSENHRLKLSKGTFIKAGLYGGTPDYLSDDFLIEIKTAGIRSEKDWGEENTDDIPPYYLTQIQWYLGLTDKIDGYCAVLIGGNDYREYKIKRNDKLLHSMRLKARHFWNEHIEKKNPPVAGEKDEEILNLLHKQKTDIYVERYDLDDLGNELFNLQESIKISSRRCDEITNIFKQNIGENVGIRGGHYEVSWKKISDSRVTDWCALAKSYNPDSHKIEEFTKRKEGYRRFKIKPM